jgi:ABC-type transport system involved in multi-copper enzyme maturation permease subunit
MAIIAIAKNTFKETARNKVSIVILIIAAVGILLTKALSYIAPETEQKMVIDFGILLIAFFGAIIAIFNGSSLIYKDLEKRTIYTVMSKPIHRYQFVVGKFLGLFFSISLSLSFLALVFVIYCFVSNISLSMAFLWAIIFIYLQICMIISVSMVFSLLSSPLLSATFTLMFYIFGYWLEGLKDLVYMIQNPIGKKIIVFVYDVLPKLFYLDFKYQASHGLLIPMSDIFFVGVYGTCYVLLFLFITALILNKKEL